MSNKVEKKSPIKNEPLRSAGQSLEEQIEDTLLDKLLYYIMFATFMIMLTIFEWVRYLTDSPPNPRFTTFLALIVIGFCAFQIYKVRRQLVPMQLGLKGERSVGQELEKLRTQGCHVYHDIPAGNFNIDHVVISTKGIFAIETKTYSKPARGQASVTFDGKDLKVNGIPPERDPVVQAKANASWVKELMQSMTGKSYPVKPVVVFPGWYIESSAPDSFKHAWVLNPKALPKWIENEREAIASEDVQLAMNRLELHVRGFKE